MTIDAGLDYHELTNINADGTFAGAARLLDFKCLFRYMRSVGSFPRGGGGP